MFFFIFALPLDGEIKLYINITYIPSTNLTKSNTVPGLVSQKLLICTNIANFGNKILSA